MRKYSSAGFARKSVAALMAVSLVASFTPAIALADTQSGAATVQATATALDSSNLQDGTYTVNMEMLNYSNPGQNSMSDNAFDKPITITVSNGNYYATVQMHGISITLGGTSFFGYLKELSYWNGSSYQPVTYDSYYDDVVDSFNDANGDGVAEYKYPKQMTFPLLNKDKGDSSEGYVQLQVFVPIMESISAGSGTQPAYMSIDWSTLQRVGGSDPVTPVTPTDPTTPTGDPQTQVETARTSLNATISSAKAISNADGTYTAESFKALADAIAAAETTAADSAATADQLNAAAQSVSNAQAALVKTADVARQASLDALNAAVKDAKAISNADGAYTTESFKTLTDAISAGEKAAANSSATKDALDAAAKAITDAKAGLVTSAEAARQASLEALNAAVEDAKAISNSDGTYTAASFKALTDAIAAAETTAADAASTKGVLDTAAKAVTDAKAGLVTAAAAERQASADALAKAISEAKGLSNADGTYTDSSFKALAGVIEAAEKVVANEYATKAQLDSTLQTVTRAKDALVTTRSVSLEALQKELDSAKAVSNAAGTYSDASFQALQDAIATAERLAADSTSKPDQLDAAATALTNARSGLTRATTATVGGVSYELSGGSVSATGASSDAKTVTIAATVRIGGVTYQVTGIKAGAFAGNKKLAKATIGKNVSTIGASAFKGCSKLKSVTFKGKAVKSIGSQAFKGIAKKATFKAPSGKKAAYKKLVKRAGAPKGFKVK